MATNDLNSFSENMRIVLNNQANELSLLTSMQRSMSENAVYTTYTYNDNNNLYHEFQLPSFASIQNRLTSIENSIQSLLTGRGSISTEDGNRYHVTIKTVPTAPDNITYLQDPSIFYADPNWLFEDYMFPAAKVRISLNGQIDDKTKQVYYKRVILDATKSSAQAIWNNKLKDHRYTYPELINILIDEGINYYEDTQTVLMPHASNSYWGTFLITEDPYYISGLPWYLLDTIKYSSIDKNGTELGANNTLKVGDNLLYNNALFEILEIDENNNNIRIKCINGVAIPGNGSMLHYYNDITTEKYVDIRFGAHEYNFIYLKAVSSDNNILSNAWSQCIKFATDELSYYDYNTNKLDSNFLSFYENNIYDWGTELLAKVKERHIPAYMAATPNVPILNADDLKVTVINTHLNDSLVEKELQQVMREIESAKSQIDSILATLTKLRAEITKTTSREEYNNLLKNIELNLNVLQTALRSYTTLVNNAKSMYNNDSELSSITYKYRIRGFFPLPAPVYYDAEKTREQNVIGFDIAYRYLSANKQSNSLKTYTYVNTDKSKAEGVFSDWIETQTKIKERKYNKTTEVFEWVTEPTADGSVININQIDIPIQYGECVEIKIRSITEAGYPENPVKSEWSNSVTIEFPDSLKLKNSIESIITSILENADIATLNTTLQSEGILTHIQDSINVTSNTGNSTNFKHQSKYIAFEDILNNTVQTISLHDKILTLDNRISVLENKYNNIIDDITNINDNIKIMATSLKFIGETVEVYEKYYQQNNTTNSSNNSDSSQSVQINHTLPGMVTGDMLADMLLNLDKMSKDLTTKLDDYIPTTNGNNRETGSNTHRTSGGGSTGLGVSSGYDLRGYEETTPGMMNNNQPTSDSNMAAKPNYNSSAGFTDYTGYSRRSQQKNRAVEVANKLAETTIVQTGILPTGSIQSLLYSEEFYRRQQIISYVQCTKTDEDFEALERKISELLQEITKLKNKDNI